MAKLLKDRAAKRQLVEAPPSVWVAAVIEQFHIYAQLIAWNVMALSKKAFPPKEHMKFISHTEFLL